MRTSVTSLAPWATSTPSQISIASGGFGTTTLRGLNISGLATSTANVGFSITTGCYAIGTTCLSGSSASTTLLGDFNTFSGTNTYANLVTFPYSSSTLYSSFTTASTTNLIVNNESFNDLTGAEIG